MNDLEKQFENYAGQIKFDDAPDTIHRERLEKTILQNLSRRQYSRPKRFWRKLLKSQITKFAVAAAVIFITSVLVFKVFSGTDALAQIVKALDNVKNVHITSQYVLGNGKEESQHFWLRKPDGLREQGSGYEIIDNGKERLFLDKEKMTAQISESWLKEQPVAENYMFDQVQMFRNNTEKDIKLTKLENESNEKILVYSISDESGSTSSGKRTEFAGKAWVDAKTMLPIKIEAALKGQADPNEAQSGVITFDYAPIPDEVFATNIPSEYKILPRKETAYVTGKVIDENGVAVEGVIVVIGSKFQYKTQEEYVTDKTGNFAIKLSPMEYKRPAYPLMIRAYKKDDPSKVAWTIIKRPLDKTKYSLEIPGKVGSVRGDDVFVDASGVELQMELAGRIYGKVTDENGNPIQNAKVSTTLNELYEKTGLSTSDIEVRGFGGTGDEYTAIAITDNEGRYEITNLPRFFDGTVFNVRVEAADYVTDQDHFRTKGPLETKNVDFKLYKAAITVKGVVKDNYGVTLNKREILVSVGNKRYLSLLSLTDKEGSFIIKGCPEVNNLTIVADLGQYPSPTLTREEFKNYRYYAPVSTVIDYQEGKKEYEVELTAERPDNILEIEVRNSAGELLPYFPIEIRSPWISTGWRIEKNFVTRTNTQGKCRFTEIPNIKGLEIILQANRGILNEKLDGEIKKIADEYKKKYFWNEIPVEFVEGQKEYKVKATALTQNEWYELQKNKNK
jgi:outer membrane lipoprotein-sorting protein